MVASILRIGTGFMRLLGSLCTFTIQLILSFILNLTIQQSVVADIQDTIVNTLTSLSCETQGVGDLLRSEFSHTCVPAPYFTFLIANLVAPATYANTLLRLKINDDDLFPGACTRQNRIEPNDPKISFALCSNVKLTTARANAVAVSAVAISRAILTGEDPWNDIKSSWTIPKSSYHNIFTDKREGDTDIMYDIGLPPVIPWKIIKDKDKLCVATTTIVFGWIPVGCKYIKEPYPQSIYARFMDLDNVPYDNTYGQDSMSLTSCSNAGGGCYQRAFNNSKTGIVMSSPIIECIKEMAARLLVSNEVCTFNEINAKINTIDRNTSALFQFQKNMHRFVAALLSLYVVLYGFKIVLMGDVPPKAELMNFIVKIIFVAYFAIGININNSSADKLDGMIQWVFPFLLGGIEQIASWVLTASPSDLCKFNPSDYPTGFSYIALWDSLDCRLSHYLGLDMLQNALVENYARNHDFAKFDFFNFSIPPYYYLLVPAVISGDMTLVSLALMYPLLVISVAAYVVNATVICLIGIVILGILAPLFVPMLLFEYTKGYFEAWVKLLISFLLQPMVVVTFMITMFSIYDVGFYGKCKYASTQVKIGERQTKVFYVDNHWDHYNTTDDVKDCQNSLGYMLNNPVAALYDFSKATVDQIVKPKNKAEEYIAQFAFLGAAVTFGPALFFVSPKLAFEKIKDIILALLTACFALYLMYHFSAQLSEFAADMTEGVSLSSVTINPQTLFKAGQALIGAAGGAIKGAGQSKPRGGIASDQVSVQSTGVDDQVAIKEDEKALVVSQGAKISAPLTSAPSSASLPKEIEEPFVPTRQLSSSEVKSSLLDFFKEKNIESTSIAGFSENEFSRYLALSSDKDKFEKVKSVYEASIEQVLSSGNIKGSEADFVNKIEGLFSGTQKKKISEINSRVLHNLSIERKLVAGQTEGVFKPEAKVTKEVKEKPLTLTQGETKIKDGGDVD
jgi:type IV secretion system protein VirB6